jgi:hypothetical protein
MRKWPARLKPMNPKEPSSTLRGRFVAGEFKNMATNRGALTPAT